MARRPPRRASSVSFNAGWVGFNFDHENPNSKVLQFQVLLDPIVGVVTMGINIAYAPRREEPKELHQDFFTKFGEKLKELGISQSLYFPRKEQGWINVQPSIDADKFGTTEAEVVRSLIRLCVLLDLSLLEYLHVTRRFQVRVWEDGFIWEDEGTWMLTQT